MMWQWKFINFNKWATLVGDVDSKVGCEGRKGKLKVYGNSILPNFLRSSNVHRKSPRKSKITFQIYFTRQSFVQRESLEINFSRNTPGKQVDGPPNFSHTNSKN